MTTRDEFEPELAALLDNYDLADHTEAVMFTLDALVTWDQPDE